MRFNVCSLYLHSIVLASTIFAIQHVLSYGRSFWPARCVPQSWRSSMTGSFPQSRSSMNMGQRNAAFGPPHIALRRVMSCLQVFRLGGRFGTRGFMYWTGDWSLYRLG